MALQCASTTSAFPGQAVGFALCTIPYDAEDRRLGEKLKTNLADMDVSGRGDHGNLDILISFGTEPTIEPSVLQFVNFSRDWVLLCTAEHAMSLVSTSSTLSSTLRHRSGAMLAGKATFSMRKIAVCLSEVPGLGNVPRIARGSRIVLEEDDR